MISKRPPDEKLNRLSALAQGIADQIGLLVVEVKFGQEGRRRTVEVTIFRPDQAVSHDDCEQLSRLLDAAVEAKSSAEGPLVDGAISLVVQSPGINRVLKTDRELQIFAGQQVQIQTREKVSDLGLQFTGVLLGATETELRLAHPKPLQNKKLSEPIKNDDLSINRKSIVEIRLFAPELAPKKK